MSGFLRTTRTKHDEDVDADDAVEVDIAPGFWAERQWTEYRMLANNAGVRYDYYRGPDGLKPAWNPEWKVASKVNPEGWQFEASIALDSFQKPVPGPGDEWGLQLVRIWKKLKEQWDVWGWGKRLPDDGIRRMQLAGITAHRNSMFGVMRFGSADDPIVRVGRTGALEQKDLDWKATLINPSDKEMKLLVKLCSDTSEIDRSEEIVLAAGGKAEFADKRTINNFSTSSITFEVFSADGKTLYYRSVIPFYLKQTMGILMRRYPSYEKFRVELDLGTFSNIPAKELSVDLAIKDKKKNVVWEKKALLTGYKDAVDGSTKGVAPGDYELNVIIRRADTVLAEEKRDFIKKEFPEWWGNKYGKGPNVPTPFVDITVDKANDSINLWGRTYAYKGNLFPASITTQGKEILASPVELILTNSDGSVTKVEKADAVNWKKITKKRVEFVRTANVKDLKITVSGWAEYDGLNWYDLKLENSKPIKLKGVRLLIIYTKPFSELMNVYDYGVSESGFIPEDGYRMSVRPLWLGNGNGGMQWLAESTAGWTLAEPKKALQIVPRENGATVFVNFADSDVTIGQKALSVDFGLNATPVRPPYPRYRLINRLDHPVYFTGGAWSYKQRFNPATLGRWRYFSEAKDDARGRAWKKQVDTSARYISGGVYYTSGGMHPENDDYRYWGDEWSNNANFIYVKDPTITNYAHHGDVGVCQAAPSWQDFTVWHYAKLFEETPCRGVYADDGPAYCSNPHHGHKDPLIAMLGYREIIKRIYEVLREMYPDGTYNIHHMSGMRNMALEAFYDVYATGENFSSRITMGNVHYASHFRVDAFKSESMGHNWGPTCWFLPQLHNVRAPFVEKYGKEREKWYPHWAKFVNGSAEYLIGLILLHDSTLWPAWIPKEPVKYMRDGLRKADFNMSYDYIPYWSQTIVKLENPDTYASFYIDKKRRRVLLVYLNHTEDSGPVRMKLDWKQLGLEPDRAKAENLAHKYLGRKNWAKVAGDELQFSSGAQNYRLIYISGR